MASGEGLLCKKAFYEFYDAFLAELLTETQKVFPDLSMEVRLDADPVKKRTKRWKVFLIRVPLAVEMHPAPVLCTVSLWGFLMKASG